MNRLHIFTSCLPTLLFFSLMLACPGCWEEIRYDPSQDNSTVASRPSGEPAATVEETTQASDDILPTPDTPTSDAEPPVTESIELEQPEAEEPAGQPDEPLSHVLNAENDSASTTPAPPSEFDLFNDSDDAEASKTADLLTSSQAAAAAWKLGSKWSLAAAYYAKGLDQSRINAPLEQAREAALLLEIQLPDFPENLEQGIRQSTIVRYLLEEDGEVFLNQLHESLSKQHAALVELAIKSHTLLLAYRPDSKGLDPLVVEINKAAETSGLPEAVWRELIDLLNERSDFANIKKAVFKLHDEAVAHLDGPEDQ